MSFSSSSTAAFVSSFPAGSSSPLLNSLHALAAAPNTNPRKRKAPGPTTTTVTTTTSSNRSSTATSQVDYRVTSESLQKFAEFSKIYDEMTQVAKNFEEGLYAAGWSRDQTFDNMYNPQINDNQSAAYEEAKKKIALLRERLNSFGSIAQFSFQNRILENFIPIVEALFGSLFNGIPEYHGTKSPPPSLIETSTIVRSSQTYNHLSRPCSSIWIRASNRYMERALSDSLSSQTEQVVCRTQAVVFNVTGEIHLRTKGSGDSWLGGSDRESIRLFQQIARVNPSWELNQLGISFTLIPERFSNLIDQIEGMNHNQIMTIVKDCLKNKIVVHDLFRLIDEYIAPHQTHLNVQDGYNHVDSWDFASTKAYNTDPTLS